MSLGHRQPVRRYDLPLDAAKYVSTGTDGIYRAIVGVLYEARELGQVLVKRDDILADVEARRPLHLPPYGVAALEADLRQLVEWGTIKEEQDWGGPLADVLRKNFRYALTEEVVAIERGLRDLLARKNDKGALDPSLLTHLHESVLLLMKQVATPIAADPSDARATLRATWVAFYDRFRALKNAGVDFQSAVLSQEDTVEVSLETLVAYKQLLRANLQAFGTRLRDYIDMVRIEFERWDAQAVPQWMIPVIARDDLEMVARPGAAPDLYMIEARLLEEWRAAEAWFAVDGAGASLADSTVHAVQRAIQDTLRLQDQLVIGDGRRRDMRRLAALFAACPSVETAHRVAAVVFQMPRIVHLQGAVAYDEVAENPWVAPPIIERVGPMQRGRRPRAPEEPVADTTAERQALLAQQSDTRREDRMQWAQLLADGPRRLVALEVSTPRLRTQVLRVIATCLGKPGRATRAPDGSMVRYTAEAGAPIGSVRGPDGGVLWIPAGVLERVGFHPAAALAAADAAADEAEELPLTMEVA